MDTKPHNYRTITSHDPYMNQGNQNQSTSGYNNPSYYHAHGTPSQNRPPVVGQGGCCCNVM